MEGGRDDLGAWLALSRAPGFGAVSFAKLLANGRSPRQLLTAPRELGRELGLGAATLEYLAAPDWTAVDAELAWCEQTGNAILTLADPAYPRLLKEIPDPPPLLYLRGDPALLAYHQLAMVGSRNPTAGGRETAREFARFLAGAGLAISSGLALGIDAASHEGALDTGTTLAIVGTGLDRVYPARHRDLAHRIAERGLLVSEFPLGVTPRPENFPRRNRIISGLSLGVLVVEATTRSGSLITARLAAEQGREVFAIPGSIHNPLARGCHQLIRQGAKLVETAADVLEELGSLAGVESLSAANADAVSGASPEAPAERDGDYQRLLAALGFDPVPVDLLVERSGLTAEAVSSMLLVLELNGEVASRPGGTYARVAKRM